VTHTEITASMLYDYTRCPHRVELDVLGDWGLRDKVSPFLELLWERGQAFELETIQALTQPFANLRAFPLAQRESATRIAMAQGEPLIYGGRIRSGDLLGEPDLLRRAGSGYVAGDIKSGAGLKGETEGEDGTPKKHYAVQLALYEAVLDELGSLGAGHPFIWDVRGNEVIYDLDRPRGPRVTSSMRSEYHDVLDDVRRIADAELTTTPALVGECSLCHWRSHCRQELKKHDDLSLIPEVGRSRRDSLRAVFSSVASLASAQKVDLQVAGKSIVPGIGLDMLERLHIRAQLLKAEKPTPIIKGHVVLPGHARELHFDVETDPMRDRCYLHGFVERSTEEPTSETYHSFFADEPTDEAEREAFGAAWELLTSQPPASIFVYSKYERTTLCRLATRFPEIVTQEEVLRVFAEDRVVDLYYDVVQPKTEWPTHSYGIKAIATFLGFQWRDHEPSGAASVRWYHDWVDTRDVAIKQRILEYNEDDCRAMRVLVDFLRSRVA